MSKIPERGSSFPPLPSSKSADFSPGLLLHLPAVGPDAPHGLWLATTLLTVRYVMILSPSKAPCMLKEQNFMGLDQKGVYK